MSLRDDIQSGLRDAWRTRPWGEQTWETSAADADLLIAAGWVQRKPERKYRGPASSTVETTDATKDAPTLPESPLFAGATKETPQKLAGGLVEPETKETAQ